MVPTGDRDGREVPFGKSCSVLPANPDRVLGLQNKVISEELYEGPECVCVCCPEVA